ncbi:anti-sigma-factor antagonist [Mycobacterium sp. BK558]|nr:anti-sigma-factor antagonist [Mycobacterium sp. BK558]
MNLTLSTDGTALTLSVGGDLDYQSTGELISAVSEALAGPAVTDLRLDFTELAFCDSAGLSGLLLIHRRTSIAGVHLHLDNRPAQLQRILDITGVLEHLTSRPARDEPSESGIL